MAKELSGKRVALLVDQGFEQVELTRPRKAIEDAGGQAVLVSPREGSVRAWNHTDWGVDHAVDQTLDGARAEDFDALVLPGGVMSPDHLRGRPEAVQFVRAFFEQDKPVAAICHGPWTLIEADVVKGRTLTSFPSLKTDLRNAGAKWVDQEVTVDGSLVTSRKPDDLDAFCREMISAFAGQPAPV